MVEVLIAGVEAELALFDAEVEGVRVDAVEACRESLSGALEAFAGAMP